MSKSSSRIVRVVYMWDNFFSHYFYLVFYSSGAVRKYDRLTIPAKVNRIVLTGPCVCWRDGECWVFDLLEDDVNV